MATTNAELEVLKIVSSGLVGALAAIAAQIVTNIFATQRHKEQLRQKERELTVQFLSPISERRLHAYEMVYDTIQHAIENTDMDMQQYNALRPLLLYFPRDLRSRIIGALTALVRSTMSDGTQAREAAIKNLRAVQKDLESHFGAAYVNTGIAELFNMGGSS